MYENITFESILKAMLERVSNSTDKREGSVIYDALAPTAIELQNTYINIENVLNQTFADTAAKEYLIKRCKERGIEIEPATYAIRQGEFNIDVPIGSRFSLNVLDYVVIEKIEDGIFKLQCETLGTAGNKESGALIPIDYIEGLQSAMLTDVLVNGEDEEDVEHLRQRYFESFDSQAFGGNAADYKKKIKALPDVGGTKVYRTPNGGGTVKAVIIDTTYSKPSDTVVNNVQNEIDPVDSHGEGLGIAPIGHTVEIIGCHEQPIEIKTTITLQKEWDWETAKRFINGAVDEYFKEIAKEWESNGENNSIVRISKIESKIVELDCVFDISNTLLKWEDEWTDENVSIDKDSIPIRKGDVVNV